MAHLRTLVRSSRWDGITPPHVDGRHITFDLTSLVAHLILSDHVVLRSSAFGEIGAMVRTFGFDATLELLASDALSIYCHYMQVADLSQTVGFGTVHRPEPLPLFSYHFGFTEPQEYVERGLRRIDDIDGLTLGQTMDLKKCAVGKLAVADTQCGRNALDQLAADLTENRGYVQAAVHEVLRRVGIEVDTVPWTLRVTEQNPHDYLVETDRPQKVSISDKRASGLISSGLMALGQLNSTLEEMRHHAAIDEFNDDDIRLIRARVSHTLGLLDASQQERRLWRLIGLHRSFQAMPVHPAVTVDLRALLRFRDTSECKDFRRWLAETDDIADDDLRQQLNSVEARLGSAAATAVGRTLRWLTISGIGLALNPVAAVALGAADAFLLQRLLDVPTPILVMNRDVPSIVNR